MTGYRLRPDGRLPVTYQTMHHDPGANPHEAPVQNRIVGAEPGDNECDLVVVRVEALHDPRNDEQDVDQDENNEYFDPSATFPVRHFLSKIARHEEYKGEVEEVEIWKARKVLKVLKTCFFLSSNYKIM